MAELSGYQQRIRARKRWLVENDQSLQSIADQNGEDINTLLADNPKVQQLRPGMVINVRTDEAKFGGDVQLGCLPSNGPLGRVGGGLAAGADNFHFSGR